MTTQRYRLNSVIRDNRDKLYYTISYVVDYEIGIEGFYNNKYKFSYRREDIDLCITNGLISILSF